MANSYMQMGAKIGDVLGALGGADVEGYTAGIDAGSKTALRNVQAAKAGAEAQKILEELDAARAARDITAEQIAQAQGISPAMYQAVTRGQTQYMPGDAVAIENEPLGLEDISPVDVRTAQSANTLKLLQQMGGGNANVLAQAMANVGKEAAIRDMVAGTQEVSPVAEAMAAIEGKVSPGATARATGSKSVASDVQMMNFLMSEKGGKLSAEEARAWVLDPAINKALRAMLSGRASYTPEEVSGMLPTIQQIFSGEEPGPGFTPPSGAKVYDYTQ